MRTVILAGLALLVVAVAVWVQPPPQKTGAEAVTGSRLVRIPRHAVQRVEVSLDGRQVVTTATAAGWTIDGQALPPALNAAVDDLIDGLVHLRAIDQFRGASQQRFGLDAPRGVITVTSARRTVRLSLGAFTGSTAALYARRDRDPRVFLIGTYLLSQIERVFDRRDVPAPPAP